MQGSTDVSKLWRRGNGFSTNPAFLAGDPNASSAQRFFESVIGQPYLPQIILAPHLYCPAVRSPYPTQYLVTARLYFLISRPYQCDDSTSQAENF